MGRSEILRQIQQELSSAPAADVADMFMSPFVEDELFLGALEEDGPSMWIVNRSDVWSEVLDILKRHPLEFIATRASDKLAQRSSHLFRFPPPQLPENLAEIGDESVEEVLGHPIVPLEAILFFSRTLSEDHRGSAALSLSRRLLEYPPRWLEERVSRSSMIDCAARLLLEDTSAFVRAYAARIPILEESLIREAFTREKNSNVRTRLLQHPATAPDLILSVLHSQDKNLDPSLSFVAALDRRSPHDARNYSLKNQELPLVSKLVHSWYLEREFKA